ncbi:MAG: 50S ribosomal protein L3 N(5)-glutamine methyltransferase, partial [Rubrivivax sp.]|nr:50S ribosomal protein L3 N(5)-glutamine methyltransferase [Rubrivivax sp.]
HNAFDEAAWLVLWALHLPLGELDERAQDAVALADLQRAQALVSQRIDTRKPAAYLTGEAWLQGVPFYVDERVIVPRSLIAEPLVEGTMDSWLSEHTHRVLDLCTGNGSLAILAAMAWPSVFVQATDLSADALAVAARNVQRHGLQDRITLLQGDGLAAAPGRYDLILCNPPYVNSRSMAALPPEFRAEPALALDGGRDGMAFIRRLMKDVRGYLSDHGVLVLEVGHERQHFEAAFPRLPVVGLPTSAGDDQVLLIEAEDLS